MAGLIKLYHKETYKEYLASPEELPSLLASDKWVVADKNAVVSVVNRETGERATAKTSELDSLSEDWGMESYGSILGRQEEQHRQEKYGDGILNTALAGVEGIASGLTLGLSDVALEGLGADTAERRQYNPIAGTVGEVAGAVVPALLTGGASAGVSGAKVAGTLAKTAATVGRAGKAGSLAARALRASPAGQVARLGTKIASKGAGKGVAVRAAAMAAGGATEGALFGVGHAVSRLALEDQELTGERIVSLIAEEGLTGAALGGVLGGATSVGADVIKGVGGKVADLVNVSNRKFTSKDIEGLGVKLESGLRQTDEIGSGVRQQADVVDEMFVGPHGDFEDPLVQAFGQAKSRAEQAAEKLQLGPDKVDDWLKARRKKDIDAVVDDVAEYMASHKALDRVTREIAEANGIPLKPIGAQPPPVKKMGEVLDAPSPGVFDPLKKSLVPVEESLEKTGLTQAAGELPDLGAFNRATLSPELTKWEAVGGGLEILNQYTDLDVGDLPVIGFFADLLVKYHALKGGAKVIARMGGPNVFRSDSWVGILAKTSGKVNKTDGLIAKVFSSTREGAAVKGTAVASSVRDVLRNNYQEEGKYLPKEIDEAFLKVAEQMQALPSDEASIRQRWAGVLELIPKEAHQSIIAAEQRRVQFLQEKLGEVGIEPTSPLIRKKKTIGNPKRSKYVRYLRAANDPQSVLRDIANGHLSAEAVEVMKTVYPRMLMDIREQVLQHMDKYDRLPRRVKIQLSKLLGNLEPSVSGNYYRKVQEATASPEGQGEPSGGELGPPPRPGANALDGTR